MTTPWEELVAALETGDTDALRTRLAASADLAEARGPAGESPVMAALYRGRRDLAELVAEAKAELDLFESVGLGRLREVSAADADAVSPDGFPALALACYLAQAGAAELLLGAGATVDAVATNGSELRAIHAAVAGGELECLRLVLAAGPQVDAPQRGGYTALQAAAHRGNVPMVELLLAAGADPDRAADDGRTARDQGAEHPAVVAALG